MITDAFWCPTWAFCSRPVSLVSSPVLWFVPRGIPRRVSSMDEFEAFVLDEVNVVLEVALQWQSAGQTAAVLSTPLRPARRGLEWANRTGGLDRGEWSTAPHS